MKTILGLVGALALASVAAAQPIHGHPQKLFYASPAEWVPVDCQGWINDPDPLKAGHIHVVPKFPLYYTVLDWANVDIPFTVKAHNIAGVLGLFTGEHIKSVRWDDGGTTDMPPRRGDPNGLIEWHGVATIDYTLGDDGFLHIFKFPLHGWSGVKFFSRTYLDNADTLDVGCNVPVYSLLDPTAPITDPVQQGNPGTHILNSVVLWRPNQGAIAGEVIADISDYIPLAPISSRFETIANDYNYTGPVTLGDERFEERLDPDLHHGIRGSLRQGVDVGPRHNRSFFGPIVLDPAAIGPGDHKDMNVWTQPLGAESISAVIVFPFAVAAGVPPPLLCTDPTATNVGGPLPCTYLPPPPLDVWTVLLGSATGPSIRQLVTGGVPQARYRIYVSATAFDEFAIK